MAIENKLDYLLETKKQIKNSIIEKGIEVLETDTFRSYADKIEKIKSGPKTDKWQAESDWYDIEEILNNDTTECYAKAIALLRSDIETGLMYNQIRGAEHYNINGEICIDADPDEIIVIKDYLKQIEGKPSKKGYNTKYIIYYIDRPQTKIMIPNSSIYTIFKGFDYTSQQAFNEKVFLEAIKFIDSKHTGTSMSETFANSDSLQSITGLNTKHITNMSYMFNNCTLLQEIEGLDTTNVTNMKGMFNRCILLKTIPNLETSKVTDMSYMFNECSSLTTISKLNMNKVNSLYNMFYKCYILLNINNISNIYRDINMSSCFYLLHETLIRILNALMFTTTTKTLQLGTNNLVKLTDEEKAIAISKGWTLA